MVQDSDPIQSHEAHPDASDSGSGAIVLAKRRLREELLARREALGGDERRLRGEAACGRLHELLTSPELSDRGRAERVFLCLSFGSEIDTWGLVERLLAEGRELYVPRADRATGRLHVHRYPCALTTLSFGLRQPKRSEPELDPAAIDSTLDAAVVLGVGFDRLGFRLGYGSGFFDRFLAGRPFPAFGLTLEDQLVDRLPVAPHDVPMRALVTERAVYLPTAAPLP